MSIFCAGALAATFVAFSMAPALAIGSQVQEPEPQVRQTEQTPNGKAPMPTFLPVPVTSPPHPGCTPTTSLLRFDGGYEVSMCYRTPDTPDGTEGVTGQAKAGLYASAESGLLWFFSRDNAEVLVKVLNGCAINGYRWVFTAPVTTLEFDLRVTSPTGARWTHTNTQGETAATRSDVAAFACADEPDEAIGASDASMVSTASDAVAAPTLAPEPQAETAAKAKVASDTLTSDRDDSDTSDRDTSVFVPVTSPDDSGCTPTTGLLHFDGGYEVSMCYRTPDTPDGTEGVTGQAKAGLYASAESGLLWFFSRDNAEVLVKVLNGCAINGYRWVFVAPVTTLEFDLRVTSSTGALWTHANRQGETAATKSDVAAFACADEPEAAPDLIVSEVTVSDANPVVGQIIELRATVLNRGDDPATPTTLRYYSSPDSTIDTSDDLLASDAVAALSAAGTMSATLDFRAPSTPGTFYLGACIEPFSAESDTGNNCSEGVRVVVEDEPDVAPDLIVSRVSVSDANPVVGQTITLSATVRNGGDGPATPTTLRFYRSNDSTIDTSDDLLASDTVAALAAAATVSATLDFRVPSTRGTFYLGACIDPVSAESDTGNNCSEGVRVVVEDEPDLIVSRVSVSDANPLAGQTITLSVTVRNRGDGPATPTTLRFYRSSDSTISAADDLLASDAVAALAAAATVSVTLDFRAPSTRGTFYFGACIDPVSAESSTSNNCSEGRLVVVREPAPPDLIVPDVTVSNENPVTGDLFRIQVTVQNRGELPASATTLRFYRSDNPTINASDLELASNSVPALAASATVSRSFELDLSVSGTFYFGACIDPVSAESSTSNNCSEGRLAVVREPAPDLTVPDVSVSNENPVTGDLLRVQVTVQNGGELPASATTLRFYRSDNPTINASDLELASSSVPTLAASATASTTFELDLSVSGTFYFGACVDSISAESDKENNCSEGRLVVVGESAPDLIVPDVSVSDENPVAGQNLEIRDHR